jgi:hypothetical protein
MVVPKWMVMVVYDPPIQKMTGQKMLFGTPFKGKRKSFTAIASVLKYWLLTVTLT